MDRPNASSRDELKRIAHRAMIERGLLPDFSPIVLAEAGAIARAAAGTDLCSGTCGASFGARSTTTIPRTSTNSRWPNRRQGAW